MSVKTILHETLSRMDQVFYNEEHFQGALVEELKTEITGRVKPEFPFGNPLLAGGNTTYVDISFVDQGLTSIELKYPLDTFRATSSSNELDRPFTHSEMRAYDVPMYGFWRDVATLEQLIEEGEIREGYVLALTNYTDCWEKQGQHLNASSFLMHEGRKVSGTLAYSDEASEATKEEYPPVHLSGSYELTWEPYDYSTPAQPIGETDFQYTLVEVDPGT